VLTLCVILGREQSVGEVDWSVKLMAEFSRRNKSAYRRQAASDIYFMFGITPIKFAEFPPYFF